MKEIENKILFHILSAKYNVTQINFAVMQFCTVKCYELRGKLQEKIACVVWLLSQVNKRIFFILLKKYI